MRSRQTARNRRSRRIVYIVVENSFRLDRLMPIRGKPIAGLSITIATAVVIVAGIIVWPSFVESWYVHRLETGDDEAQREAAEWLATHKTAEGLYQLTRFGAMHGEGDDWRRMVGEWKFAFLGVLIRAIRDENVEVRRLAMQALVEIGPRGNKAVPALIEAIHDPDLIVRKSALFSLRSIGPDAQVAMPTLIELLQSEDWEAGSIAALALGGIGPAAEGKTGTCRQNQAETSGRTIPWAQPSSPDAGTLRPRGARLRRSFCLNHRHFR